MNATGQTSIEELRRRLQLAESLATGPQQQSYGPVGAGLRGLAQILAARNATKLSGEVAETEKAQRTGDYQLLGEMLDSGSIDTKRLGEFQNEQVAQLALALATRQAAPEDIKTYKDPMGITRYLTGPNQGQPAPGQEGYGDDVLVSPQERFELDKRNSEMRAEGNLIDREQIELQRQEGERIASKLNSVDAKALDDAIAKAQAAGQAIFEMQAIASDYEAIAPESGVVANWQEAYKSITGQQDSVTTLRTRYAGLRASEVVKNLPPGAASDKDIELALSGFLPPNANSQQVASFLRGMAKLSAFDEGYNTFKARYIDENNGQRGLIDAWKKSDELKALRNGMTTKDGRETVLVNGVEVEIAD